MKSQWRQYDIVASICVVLCGCRVAAKQALQDCDSNVEGSINTGWQEDGDEFSALQVDGALVNQRSYPGAVYGGFAGANLANAYFPDAAMEQTVTHTAASRHYANSQPPPVPPLASDDSELSSLMQDVPMTVLPHEDHAGLETYAAGTIPAVMVDALDQHALADVIMGVASQDQLRLTNNAASLADMSARGGGSNTSAAANATGTLGTSPSTIISRKGFPKAWWEAAVATQSNSPTALEYALACYGPLGGLLVILLMPLISLLNVAAATVDAAGTTIATGVGTLGSAFGLDSAPVFTAGALWVVVFWVITGMFIGWCAGGFAWVSLGFCGGMAIGLLHMLLGETTGYFGMGVYFAFVAFAGYLYITYLSWRFVNLPQEHQTSTTNFMYSLFDGLFPGRNQQAAEERVCCLGLFCTSVLWADTASSPKIASRHDPPRNFWLHVFGFAAFTTLTYVSYGLTSIFLLIWLVHNRQRIRKAYNITYGTPQTYVEDACIWTLCSPCAAMQEALQVFFVALPRKAELDDFVSPRRGVATARDIP